MISKASSPTQRRLSLSSGCSRILQTTAPSVSTGVRMAAVSHRARGREHVRMELLDKLATARFRRHPGQRERSGGNGKSGARKWAARSRGRREGGPRGEILQNKGAGRGNPRLEARFQFTNSNVEYKIHSVSPARPCESILARCASDTRCSFRSREIRGSRLSVHDEEARKKNSGVESRIQKKGKDLAAVPSASPPSPLTRQWGNCHPRLGSDASPRKATRGQIEESPKLNGFLSRRVFVGSQRGRSARARADPDGEEADELGQGRLSRRIRISPAPRAALPVVLCPHVPPVRLCISASQSISRNCPRSVPRE